MPQYTRGSTSTPRRRHPREFRLLCSIIAGTPPAPIDVTLADWAILMGLAVRHEVVTLLGARLPVTGIPHPDWVHDEISAALAANRGAAAHLVDVTARTSSILSQSGVRCIALKGPLLGQALLGDPALRYSKDVDLMVDADETDCAVELLKRAGYSVVKDTAISRHLTLAAPANDAWIELHYRLYAEHGEPEPSFGDMWDDRSTIRTPLGEVAIPSNRHNLLSLVAHGNYHAWARLKWATDIHQLLANMPEAEMEQAVADSARYYGTRSLSIGLACVGRLLGSARTPLSAMAPGDALLLRTLWPAMLAPMLSPDELPPSHRDAGTALRQLAMHGAAPFLQTLFAPSHLDAEFWRLPRGLQWAYPALRPVRLVWQKGFRRSPRRAPSRSAQPSAPTLPSNDGRFQPTANVIVQEFEGETVLLDMGTETFYGLDGVGLAIWESLARHGRLSEVVSELVDKYEVPAEQVREDVEGFVAQMQQAGLVEPTTDEPPNTVAGN